ncbi:DUF3616 domain-containing protein [Phormidium tenue FACHB-886]|nr:DUF3616 domain-containing protein [Phormidium tenue FACHB-886]
MNSAFLLSRLLLHFNGDSSKLPLNLSAIALTPDGSLWLGSDEQNSIGSEELNTLERLSLGEPQVFANQTSFAIRDFLPIHDEAGEIDIEGLDYSSPYLWLTGSHSSKRKKPKGKTPEKDFERLTKVKSEPNRYLIARIPVAEGQLYRSCASKSNEPLTAAFLKLTDEGNELTEALKEDPHLGEILKSGLPSKENGFDIEGLAAYGSKLFLGLRGPVLRGWAVVLEIELEELEPGVLTLKPVGKKNSLYRKHFLDLDGLGIREMVRQNQDLLILAGPTMDLAGTLRLYRFKDALERSTDSLCSQSPDQLTIEFDLPYSATGDKAEGMTLFPCVGQASALMVVYDAPDANRLVGANSVFADVFKLSDPEG